MKPVNKYTPNARIFVLVEDYIPKDQNVHPQKKIIQVQGWTKVNSVNSVENGGSAEIELNDINLRYWKYYPLSYIYSREFNDNLTTSDGRIIDTPINIQYSLRNKKEIIWYKQLLNEYKTKDKVYSYLYQMMSLRGAKIISEKKGNVEENINIPEEGGFLKPLFDLQNVIWIHYLAPDGYWYPGFKGLITDIGFSYVVGDTPKMNLKAKTADRLWEYSYAVTGINNLAGISSVKNLSLDSENATIAFNNVFGNKKASDVIIDTFKKCNEFFITSKYTDEKNPNAQIDYRYFKVLELFGLPKEIIQPVKTGTEEEVEIDLKSEKDINYIRYDIGDDVFTYKKWKEDEDINPYELYPSNEITPKPKTLGDNPLPTVDETIPLFPVICLSDFFGELKPFQNLIRTNIQLDNIDKMSIKDILEVVKKSTLAYIYPDADGSIKIERQNFDLTPAGDYDYIIDENYRTELYAQYGDDLQNQVEGDKESTTSTSEDKSILPVYDLPLDMREKNGKRYIISRKDKCFVSDNFNETESSIVTRTSTWMKQDLYEFDTLTNLVVQSGKAESSPKVYGKYGLREVVLESIIKPEFLKKGGTKASVNKILNSYSEGMKLMINGRSKTASVNLYQRPDIQLNRNLVFMDLGKVGLTHTISQSIDLESNIHTTSIQLTYVRPIGYPIVNPWRFIINYNNAKKEYELKEWYAKPLTDEKEIDIGSDSFQTEELDSDEDINFLKQRTEYIIGDSGRGDYAKYLKDLEAGKVQSLIYIVKHPTNIGWLDESYKDIMYIYWKEGESYVIKKYLCIANPAHRKDTLENKGYVKYTQLTEGMYKYNVGGQQTVKSDMPETVNSLISNDFDYDYLKDDLTLDTQYNKQLSKDIKLKYNNEDVEYTSILSNTFLWHWNKQENDGRKNALNGDEKMYYDGVNVEYKMSDEDIVYSNINSKNAGEVNIAVGYYSLDEKTLDKIEKENTQVNEETVQNSGAPGDSFERLLLYLSFLRNKWNVTKSRYWKDIIIDSELARHSFYDDKNIPTYDNEYSKYDFTNNFITYNITKKGSTYKTVDSVWQAYKTKLYNFIYTMPDKYKLCFQGLINRQFEYADTGVQWVNNKDFNLKCDNPEMLTGYYPSRSGSSIYTRNSYSAFIALFHYTALQWLDIDSIFGNNEVMGDLIKLIYGFNGTDNNANANLFSNEFYYVSNIFTPIPSLGFSVGNKPNYVAGRATGWTGESYNTVRAVQYKKYITFGSIPNKFNFEVKDADIGFNYYVPFGWIQVLMQYIYQFAVQEWTTAETEFKGWFQ